MTNVYNGSLKEGKLPDGSKVCRVFSRRDNPNGHRSAIFRCKCGKDFERTLTNQKRSPNKVCKPCAQALAGKRKSIYKDKRHSRELYSIWKGMNSRCHVEKNQAYIHYGGRGITVVDMWRDTDRSNYYNFLDHVYPRPSNKHSLERLDNSKGYCPDNVEWKDAKAQMNNVRSNHTLEWEGEVYTLQQLSEKLDIKANTLLYRLRRGWSMEEAVRGERCIPHKRPYEDRVSDEDFYNVMSTLLTGNITTTKASELLGVDSGNLSRVRRKDFVIKWVEEYEKGL